MSDAPPQLGEIPQQSEMNVPTLSSNMDSNTTANGNSSVQNAKETMYNSQCFQSSRDHVHIIDLLPRCPIRNEHCPKPPSNTNCERFCCQWLGPVADTLRNEHAKVTAGFQNIADSHAPPSQPAATGQTLTKFHGSFYRLLSWQEPRATATAFASIIVFIFAARYLHILPMMIKWSHYVLGSMALLEILGQAVLSQGLASAFRPKKYFTIPRESLERTLEDVEQLINFFVIEVQRVLFVENIKVTLAVYLSLVLSYQLIKFVPFWGLSLIGTSTLFLAPLIYTSNQEFIDEHLSKASEVVNSQTAQVKDIATHHTNRASETVKAYAGDYTAKAQEYIGSARGRATSPQVNNKSAANAPTKAGPGDAPQYSSSDFPHAPKQEPTPGVTSHQEQYENSHLGGQAQPAY